jgi:hypothetical protein
MKTSLPIFLLLLTCAAIAHATDESDVRARDDQERIAALKRDTSALEELWSDEFTVNAPNNRVVVGKRAVLDTFVPGSRLERAGRRTHGRQEGRAPLHEHLAAGGGNLATVLASRECDRDALNALEFGAHAP